VWSSSASRRYRIHRRERSEPRRSAFRGAVGESDVNVVVSDEERTTNDTGSSGRPSRR
jgi:hypothetical protein